MPFCRWRLQARPPRPPGYPEEPRTLGEHLRKRRIDRGETQREAARQVGVHPATFHNWEKAFREPGVGRWPAIPAYLCYDPSPEPASLAARIRARRCQEGLSQRELGRRLGLDPGTVGAWERGTVVRPGRQVLALFGEWAAEKPPGGEVRPWRV